MSSSIRHFLRITSVGNQELRQIINGGVRLKQMDRKQQLNLLPGMSMAMIFEKPSLRTHVSFEVGATQLGGHAIYLGPQNIGLGVREPICDVSNVLSRMSDIVVARVFRHETVVELAAHSRQPVINALCDLEHPCQAVADMITVLEYKHRLDSSLTMCFVGDGNNNVTHSLALACAKLGVNFRVASPPEHAMNPTVLEEAQALADETGAQIEQLIDPVEAVRNVDVVYTDTFVSMGQEEEKELRLKEFEGYQVTGNLMNEAKSDAIFMHDMPGKSNLLRWL